MRIFHYHDFRTHHSFYTANLARDDWANFFHACIPKYTITTYSLVRNVGFGLVQYYSKRIKSPPTNSRKCIQHSMSLLSLSLLNNHHKSTLQPIAAVMTSKNHTIIYLLKNYQQSRIVLILRGLTYGRNSTFCCETNSTDFKLFHSRRILF